MSISAQEKLRLKKLIRELKSHKAPHTEFVSVYIPAGYELTKITQHLAEEQGTASNIKSAATRKNVQGALEKMIQHLRMYPKTPSNGLACFAGNLAAGEGKQDMQAWSMEPPIPLNTRIYRCDKNFVTDILEEMMVEHDVYGLVVLDRRDASLALLKGKTIVPLQKTHSEVPGKTKAGGQCQMYGTLVQTSTGDIVKIENCCNPLTVKSVSFHNSLLIDSPVADHWTVRKKEVVTIKTKMPQIVTRTSKEHTFFVMDYNRGIIEKKAEELHIGDFLLIPEKIDINGRRQTVQWKKYHNSFVISKKGRELLKQKRVEKKLLQKQFGEMVGMTQTAISFYEIGKRQLSRDPLKEVCSALDIDFERFLEESTTPHPHRSSEVRLPEEVTGELAQFLGYFIGDGCAEEDRITFFEQRKDVALTYLKLFSDFFNLSCTYRFRESKNYHQLRFTSRPLVRMILGEFPEIKKTLDTEIPRKILMSPNSVIGKFLRGLFDAEGYISGKGVGIGLNNKTLISQVQLLLLRFSILASWTEGDNTKNPYSKNPIFKLQISEKESLGYFRDYIGFTASDKLRKLQQVIHQKSTRSHVRQILYPGKVIREIIEKNGKRINDYPSVKNFFLNQRMMSKNTFKQNILDQTTDQKLYHCLQDVYNNPVLPVKISEMKIEEEKVPMIDISVANENFIANGLIVHNSSQRYARIREGAYKDHFKKVAEYMKDQFLPFGNNLKGIIIGGPGITVSDFLNKDYITGDIKKKIIGTKDLSYTDEFGFQELLDKSEDLLAEEEIAHEKKTMNRFFLTFRDNPKKITYGEKETLRALEMAAVDLLLISENVPEDKIFELEERAEQGGATVKIISTETREGVQLRDLGGIAAILRFEIE